MGINTDQKKFEKHWGVLDPKLNMSHLEEKTLLQWWKGSESHVANNNDFEVTAKGKKPAAFLSKIMSSGNLYND